MADNRIKNIQCAPFVNESEKIATEFIKTKLESMKDSGFWFLLTNLSFSSGISYKLPVEIDILAIGSKGIKIIEVKH